MLLIVFRDQRIITANILTQQLTNQTTAYKMFFCAHVSAHAYTDEHECTHEHVCGGQRTP